MGKTANPSSPKSAPKFSADASPFFRMAVESMKQRGYTRFRKRAYRLVKNERPVFLEVEGGSEGGFFPLDEKELKRPAFWVPTGFDGEADKIELCAPGWFTKRKAAKWVATWKESFSSPNHGEVSEDSGRFVRSELSMLRGPSPDSTNGNLTMELTTTALSYLEQATVEAYAAGGGFPARTIESLGEGESLHLDPTLARIIELAFRAGVCSSRANSEYRGVRTTARRGDPHVKEIGKGRRKLPVDKLPKWKRVALDILREDPKLYRKDLLTKLKSEGVAKESPSGMITLDGSEAEITFEDFSSRVTKLITSYLKR